MKKDENGRSEEMKRLLLFVTLTVLAFTGCAVATDKELVPAPPVPPTPTEVCTAWCEANGARYGWHSEIGYGLRCSCDLIVMDMVAMQPCPEKNPAEKNPAEKPNPGLTPEKEE